MSVTRRNTGDLDGARRVLRAGRGMVQIDTRTVASANALIGRIGTMTLLPGARFRVRVLDVKSAYGNTRVLVTSADPSPLPPSYGSTWVDFTRVTLLPA